MSFKKFHPFKDFQSVQIQRSSRNIFTAHYACRMPNWIWHQLRKRLTDSLFLNNQFINRILSDLPWLKYPIQFSLVFCMTQGASDRYNFLILRKNRFSPNIFLNVRFFERTIFYLLFFKYASQLRHYSIFIALFMLLHFFNKPCLYF